MKVLYTEQKTKKVKIWLDGYLVPRPTLNSVGINDLLDKIFFVINRKLFLLLKARLISAGKHEIDVVFYSSIDDVSQL